MFDFYTFSKFQSFSSQLTRKNSYLGASSMMETNKHSQKRWRTILFLGWTLQASSLPVETRISRLRPWTTVKNHKDIILGWTREERDTDIGSLNVKVWGTSSDDEEFSATIQLPRIKDQDSLAASLWPSSLAGAILCQSPRVRGFLKDKDVLELGSGLGLTGLVAADVARSCHLTDNDETIVSLLQDLLLERPNVDATYLEWREEERNTQIPEAHVVLGTDVAYYYFLLRPLMDTITAYLNPTESACFIVGQANRESQWDLYHNIADGCYNQITDEREEPWEGTTQMLLYNLEMSEWQSAETNEEPKVDGFIPIGVLHHRIPEKSDGALTEFDYPATADDESKMDITF